MGWVPICIKYRAKKKDKQQPLEKDIVAKMKGGEESKQADEGFFALVFGQEFDEEDSGHEVD